MEGSAGVKEKTEERGEREEGDGEVQMEAAGDGTCVRGRKG